MSGYRLKPGRPDFEIVDGPLAGRKFAAGAVYPEAPAGFEEMFEPAEKAEVVQMPKKKAAPARPGPEDETA